MMTPEQYAEIMKYLQAIYVGVLASMVTIVVSMLVISNKKK